MTNTEKATARPWSFHESFSNGEPIGIRIDSGVNPIADLEFSENGTADAILITRAVNNFEALLEACKLALEQGNFDHKEIETDVIKIIEQAIRQAEKEG